MNGILGYGSYIPYWRLDRAAIGAALSGAGGRGTRAVASFDEDTTSMGVEAARAALATRPAGSRSPGIIFSTTRPAYLDKTNATAIHAALGLDEDVPAYDMIGSVRSAFGAMSAGLGAGDPRLVVLSDIRMGLPGGADERDGGDAAVAFVLGDGDPLVEQLGGAHASGEFLDRWRLPEEPTARQWEERFGEFAYVPLAEKAIGDALKRAGLTGDRIDHAIVTGPHSRAVRRAAAAFAHPVDDLTSQIGYTGSAHAGLLLASVLDTAEPGQTIAVVTLADGCDVAILRTTEALAAYRPASTVAQQIAAGRSDLSYSQYLTWRGFLTREPPRRPDPERPAAPPSLRAEHWKYGFVGSRCTACGTRHLPPQRVCVRCQAVDQMEAEPLADLPATVATFTIDRLAYSLSPPVVAAVVDFDGGGRFQCEMTDCDPAKVAIGDRVEMTFRRLFTSEGVHNYFWKARPIHTDGN